MADGTRLLARLRSAAGFALTDARHAHGARLDPDDRARRELPGHEQCLQAVRRYFSAVRGMRDLELRGPSRDRAGVGGDARAERAIARALPVSDCTSGCERPTAS